jgi:predicted  nucleic acid-binding Zn-ribbon protein
MFKKSYLMIKLEVLRKNKARLEELYNEDQRKFEQLEEELTNLRRQFRM